MIKTPFYSNSYIFATLLRKLLKFELLLFDLTTFKKKKILRHYVAMI